MLVVPALVASIGLVFAVLMERVSWAVAFRTAVFMPMAISAFAAGITWRIVYLDDPNLGVANAAIKSVDDVFNPSGVLPQASPSTKHLVQQGGGMQLKNPVQAGDTAELGLTAIPPTDIPSDAQQAVAPEPLQGGISGVVWRDFKPGGGKPGTVESEELGLPGVHLDLLDQGGSKVASTSSAADGSFQFADVGNGSYTVAISASTFAKPFGGVEWLGPRLVTPAIMIAYLWIWAGFAMVVIAAGLAAIPRDVLEAARTDGASEFQVFRKVTAPLLAPVLTVVFVTMLINVLKVFDIVISIAPGSSQDDANVLALAMWRTSFGGSNDFGVGSAIAVLIFLLVIPVLAAQRPALPEGGLMATVTAEQTARQRVGAPPARRSYRWLRRAPIHLVLLVFGLLWLIPTIGLFVTSLMQPTDFQQQGWWNYLAHPGQLTLDNYRAVFDNQAIMDSLWTTVLVAVGGTAVPVIVGALAGYAFAWLEFPGRDWIFIIVVALLVVPLQMALIPMFQLYNDLNLFDTVLGLVLFHAAFGLPFAIFLLRNFFIGIPRDLMEAARIDGAGEFKIFWRLILPLGKPAIASLAIFQFLWTWNDLLVALTFGRSTVPITVAIFSQMRQFSGNIELIAPATFISLIVPLAVFFIFQRSFVQGLLAGSVK